MGDPFAAEWAGGDAALVFHLVIGGLVLGTFLAIVALDMRARRKRRSQTPHPRD